MIDVRPAGDAGWLVVLGGAAQPDRAIVARARSLAARIRAANIPGVSESVPGYASVLISYDAVAVSPASVRAAIAAVAAAPDAQPSTAPGRAPVRMPLCTCPRCAPDRDFAVGHLGRTWPDIVRAFCAPVWEVWLTGFQPGFPFLGPLPDGLALPRLPTPRSQVPPGSAGIGGAQAGIYAQGGPGGWRILGRTDARLFDARRDPPARLVPGDRVRFEPVEDHAARHFAER